MKTVLLLSSPSKCPRSCPSGGCRIAKRELAHIIGSIARHCVTRLWMKSMDDYRREGAIRHNSWSSTFRPWRSVPEGLRNKQKEKHEAQPDNHSNNPTEVSLVDVLVRVLFTRIPIATLSFQ